MATNVLIVDLGKMPIVLAAMRRQMAEMLREVAMDEDERTAERLREIAMAFEIGAGVE
ncbi:MAG: hypothetical protein ACHQX3_06415 [Nitrospirales bacterium]